MLEFRINEGIPMSRSERIFEMRLNSQWSIVLGRGPILNNTWIVKTVRIHRRNTGGKFLVSGTIKIMPGGFEEDFSQFIEEGSPTKEIFSNVNDMTRFPQHYRIRADVWITSDIMTSGMTKTDIKKTLQVKSLGELSKDLERLLDPKTLCFADVTLKCGGVSIPAHKIILSTRSPVFAAMFANQMKESRENEVDITDMDVSVLRALLTYMYTGKTSDLTSSSATDLLFAAEKYQLQDLKTVCSNYMMLNVSSENVWRMLTLGDLLCKDLKSFAMDYISNTCGEMSDLESKEEWKALQKERPDLALEISKSYD